MKEADNHKQGAKFDKQHSIISNKHNFQLYVDESQMYLFIPSFLISPSWLSTL